MAVSSAGAVPLALQARAIVGRSWLAVFAAAFALYGLTASRGVQWQDSSDLMLRIATGDVWGHLGLALTHSLHYWVGRAVVTVGGPAPLTITLVSSFFGALAVANVFGCVLRLTNDVAASLFAASSLALANTFWRLSTIVEVYTLGAALLAGCCWCLASYGRGGGRRALWLAFFVNGLGVANDLQSGLTTIVLVAVGAHEVWHQRISWLDSVVAGSLWLVGSASYAGLVLLELLETGDLPATLRSALFGTQWEGAVLGTGLSLRTLLTDVGFPLLNFPNLLLPAALLGVLRSPLHGVPPLVRRAFIAILAVQGVFALRYEVADQYSFFLPLYVVLAIFGGIGAAAVRRARPNAHWLTATAVLLLAATPLSYAVATFVARELRLLDGLIHNKPYRDDYVYLLIPWTVVDRSAEQMSKQVLALAGPRGVVVFEEWMGAHAVLYQALVDGRRDLASAWREDPGLEALLREAVAEGRAVVLVPMDRDAPFYQPPVGRWRREGDVYVLGP